MFTNFDIAPYMLLTYFVVVPILVAVLLYLFHLNRSARVVAVLVQASLTAAAYWLFTMTRQGEVFLSVGNFHSILGIYLRADLLSAVFILLTTLTFLIAAIYSFNSDHGRLFWFLMFIWQGALIGIFLTLDLFNIFVLVEVATIVVVVLIMYNRENRNMYDGMIYFLINVVVIQLYMFGMGYIYRLAGTMDMQRAGEVIAASDPSYSMLPYAALMTFIALKCALVPLFGWLPKAHGSPAAPAAVSAILSGVHIKSGVYMFIRFQEMFEPVASSNFFLALGVITAIVGVVLAIAQTDIKLILAYSTVSQVGLIFAGLSISQEYTYGGYSYSFLGGMYHAVNHAVFKGALFLSAGTISKLYGTRDVFKIRGVLKEYPVVGAATLMAILGIMGAPFFNGSISKYFMVSGASSFINGVMIFMSLGTIIAFIKYSTILFGKADIQGKRYEVDSLQEVAILFMGVLCFITGIFGVWTIEFLFDTRVTIDFWGYVEKAAIFFASVGVGYLIYKYYVNTSEFLKRIKHFDLGLRGMVVSIGLVFAAVLIAVGVL